MATIIRKQDLIVADMFDAEGEDKAIGQSVLAEGRGRAVSGMAQYVRGVAFNRRLRAGDSQKDLVNRHNVPQGNVSKLVTVARVLDFHAHGDAALEGLTNIDREKLEEQRQNLVKYYGFATEGDPNATPWLDICKAVTGDDGEVRAIKLADLYTELGAPSSAYSVCTGEKLHPNDPRNTDDEPETDEADETDDDETDDEKVSWQDRMAALVAQARLEGATASDILAVVNAALKA